MPLHPTTTAAVPGAAATRDALAGLRPGLIAAYDAHLPGARAAVLARLFGALTREPLPGLTARTPGPDATLTVTFTGGRAVRFPAAAGQPFADAHPGLHATTAGRRINDPAELAALLWPDTTLASELDNSAANLALARAANNSAANKSAANPAPAETAADLADAEQSVLDGHPLHPGCRTRAGMTTADVLAYAPEHHPRFALRKLLVPAGRWAGDAPPVLYAHPLMADRLRDEHPWLGDGGDTGPVRPLMSLRTVAPAAGGDHYKTAVDVLMTSATRTVSPAAVHNGPVLSARLAELTAGLPLDVLAETAGAVLVDGQPQRRLAYLRRAAPRLAAGESVRPLAVAAPGAGADPYHWFGMLISVLWPPVQAVLRRGVALEAHGQNVLVVERAGRPVRILYRDLGGVRATGGGLRGDVPTADPDVLRVKLAAALGSATAHLIARMSHADPDRLWAIVAAAAEPWLRRGPLPVKATTAMRLAADPLADVWASMPNPMAGHA